MRCILGPEPGIGDPTPPRRRLRSRFSISKLGNPAPAPANVDRPGQPAHHRTLSTLVCSSYDSVRSSVRRAASVRVTKSERHTVRAQDIFTEKPPSPRNRSSSPDPSDQPRTEPAPTPARGRSTTSRSTLSLDKPLPSLPKDEPSVAGDVSAHEIEGYLDMLAYSQRAIPSQPAAAEAPERQQQQEAARHHQKCPPPPSLDPDSTIRPAPKEDEWMSTRAESHTSSVANTTSDVETTTRRRRSRPLSGGCELFTRSNSTSGMSVTPMSSFEEAEREPRCGGGKRVLASPCVVAPRIEEEASEPGTASPALTPKRQSDAMAAAGVVEVEVEVEVPQACYYCGRDPLGRDAKRKSVSPMTVLDIARLVGRKEGEAGEEEEEEEPGSPSFARDGQGRRFVYDPEAEAGEYKAWKGMRDPEEREDAPKTPEPESASDDDGAVPLVRPSNPDPYGSTNSSPEEVSQRRKQAEIEIEMAKEDETTQEENLTDSTPRAQVPLRRSFYERLSGRHASAPVQGATSNRQEEQGEERDEPQALRTGGSPPRTRSFWKNPDGIILVYQGLDVGGTELYYGSDINYLGSFRDDDEGSSDLGSNSNQNSTLDLDESTPGGGLAMIPEDVDGPEELWHDEAAFEARAA